MEEGLKLVISADVENFNSAMQNAGRNLDKFKQVSASSTQTLINLSRVAQDAPYGFIGIANNLNPLLEGFQRLKAEAGGTKGALQALLSGLTGPAGIGLALGVVSALMIKFGDKLFSTASEAKRHADAIKKVRESLDEYVESLKDIDRIRVTGAQNAQEELVKLQTLYKATQNANIPLAERRKLVDQLQEQYPRYFQNIKDETILAGGATAAYNRLSNSILAAARARAAQDTLVDIQKQVLAIEQQQTDNNSQLYEVYRKINDLKATGAKLSITSLTGEDRLTESGAKMNRLTQSYNKLLSEGADLQKQRLDLLNRAGSVSAEISDITQKEPGALLDKTLDKVKKIKENVKEISRYVSSIQTIPLSEAIAPTAGPRNNISDIFKGPEIAGQAKKVGDKFGDVVGGAFSKKVADAMKKGLEQGLSSVRAQDIGIKITNQLKAATEGVQVLTDAFGSFFDALKSGENPIKAFFKSIGESIIDVIKKLVQAAIAASILSLITGGAAGGGLSFMKAFKGVLGIGGGDGGITARSGGFGDIANRIGFNGSGGLQVEVVGRLSGRDMLLQSARTSRGQGRTL